MSTNFDRGSAKIYQFPSGGRAGLETSRTKTKPDLDFVATRFADAAFGSGWYHEEAIQEADPLHKH